MLFAGSVVGFRARPALRPGDRGHPWVALITVTIVLSAGGCGDPSGPGNPTPAVIGLAPDSVRLTALGDTTTLFAEGFDGDGIPIPSGDIDLRVLDATVALVDAEGLVTALGNGKTFVVASVDEARDSSLIHVEQAAHRLLITVDPGSSTLSSLDDTVRVHAHVLDQGGSPVLDAAVAFHSTDTSVAVVDSSGLVRSRSNGTAFAVAASGAPRDSLEIRVRQVAVSLTVTPALDSIWVLGTGPQLSARGLDANGHETPVDSVEWASSDTSVLVVDAQGRVESGADGTATVTATLDEAVGQAMLVVEERGWVSVSLEEFGGGRDQDGYLVSFAGDSVPILAGTSVVVPFVPAGTHAIEVGSVADHCLSDSPPTIDVQKGDTAQTLVRVRCSGRFAFEDRVPPTYTNQLHYFDELGHIIALSQDEIVRGEAAWSRDGAWMAFAKTMGGNTDIYIVRWDGTGERRLTFDPAEDITPTWSPDGSRIAFRRVGSGEGLWAVDLATGTVERLTDGPVHAGPSWSPTAEVILFTAPGTLEPWNRELWSIRAEGTDLQQLTTDATGLGYLRVSWSPEGSRLAVARSADALWELVVMSPDASAPNVVATSGQSSLDPSWSPDGASLVFTKHDGVGYGVYRVRADGTGEVALTPELDATSATYSADGTHVLFSWTEVAAKNLDGTGLLLLTQTSASNPLPRPGS